MDIRTLQTIIVEALDDIKARDISVFDTTGGSQEFDRVIVATADVARQTRAMALNVVAKVKEAGGRIVGMEGGDTGDWVLVDAGDAIVHIMQPAMRQYYNLEELWGQKKVRVLTAADKAAATAKKVVKKVGELAEKTIEAAQAVVKKASGKKAVAKKAKVKKAVAKKAVPKKAVVKKSGPKKAVPKKAVVKKATTKKAPAKKAVVKKAIAKKAPAKKAPAKKATANKAVAKKAVVKKVPAKKAPVKKVAAKKPAPKKITKKPAKRPVVKKTAKKAAKKSG